MQRQLRLLAIALGIPASAIGFVVWLVTWPDEFRIRVRAGFGLYGPYAGWEPARYNELRETFGRDRFWTRRLFHNLKSVTEALMDYDPQGWSKLVCFYLVFVLPLLSLLASLLP